MKEINLSQSTINQISENIISRIESRLNYLFPTPAERYLSRKEGAAILNISSDTLTKYAVGGYIPFKLTGKEYLFKQSDIENFDLSQYRAAKRKK